MKRIWFPQTVVIVMLLIALNPENEYSYYIILRWVCFGVFSYLAFRSFKSNRFDWLWIFSISALIYNPFFRIHLSRDIWTYVNIVTILVCLLSIFRLKLKNFED